MRKITYLDAVNEALDEALGNDPRVFLIGEDIGVYGGGFGATKGLVEKYGEERVRSTPISEAAIAGVAVGAAIKGLRPVMELQFSDFITIAMDQIVNQAAKIHYMTGGQARVPMVMRTAGGSGTGAAAQHSQSLENWTAHIPGLIVVMPSNAYDAKGLLHAAIENENPVMIYEHKLLYKEEMDVPEIPYTIPLGVAEVKREGADISIVATSRMVMLSLLVAEKLASEGISVEVIDPRTLVPLDKQTILKSVEKTKRVLVVTEEVKESGFGGELVAIIAESELSMQLKAPIKRLGGSFTPMPAGQFLESQAIPTVESIEAAVRELVGGRDE
ncbi:pyruvate dehydrogenase E1 component beta subunit [Pilibacter termitis]|uniref:Pyruvate dehydrogenase E1 component beta subunit n=1 Tax=Pilibacter termitis TaxID=263852 RepID=A0A1T4N6S7_9ENTE|nr:alpha-ketoacid dehydrogenase subunit beta [Pilibacter termitis]SJZ74912.1 pyruvate dehydrogenase E1 component beta subunit [Pilibacter termitis]